MKRLAIFVFYDKDGIVDRYVLYYLKSLRDIVDRLVIISNGHLDCEQKNKLTNFSDKYYERENKGFDVDAYKEGLTNLVGWNCVQQYDEVILCNDTCYGPFISFSEICKEMEQRTVDFWGITKHGKTQGFSEHIQSYFMAFSKKVINDARFRQYWNTQPYYKSWNDAVFKHEVNFTQFLQNCGYTYDVFCDSSHFCEDAKGKDNYNTTNICSLYLLQYQRLPILKKKAFSCTPTEYLSLTSTNHIQESVEYISAHYAYDVSMIFENCIRLYHVNDLFKTLNLIFPIATSQRRAETNAVSLPAKSALVIIHAAYPDLVPFDLSYIDRIPQGIDVLLTTPNQTISDEIIRLSKREIKVIVVENRGRDLGALLVSAAPFISDYPYICFVHDKKSSQQRVIAGETFRDVIWNNTLYDSVYIKKVLDIFHEHPEIGVLSTPWVYFENFFDWIWQGGPWENNYETTQKLLHDLKVSVPLDRKKGPLTLGMSFWFRRDALTPLFARQWKSEDFPQEPMGLDGTICHAIERSLSYVAQSQGYLTGWVMTDKEETTFLTNLITILDDSHYTHAVTDKAYISTLYGLKRKVYKFFFLPGYAKEHIKNRLRKIPFAYYVGRKTYHLIRRK